MISRGVARTSNKVAKLYACAKDLSFGRWIAILDAARDHHRIHKSIQERQAIVIESASEEAITDSDIELE